MNAAMPDIVLGFYLLLQCLQAASCDHDPRPARGRVLSRLPLETMWDVDKLSPAVVTAITLLIETCTIILYCFVTVQLQVHYT
jgi:hypothetical protein